MIKNILSFGLLGMSAVLLAGCGGGGSSSDSAAVSVSAFPLQAGYQARIIAGHTDNFTVSGTCTGTATITNAATSASNFEGVAGFIGQQIDEEEEVTALSVSPSGSVFLGQKNGNLVSRDYENFEVSKCGQIDLSSSNYMILTDTQWIEEVVRRLGYALQVRRRKTDK